MKFGFYPKLAWIGMKKNKHLYLPYILVASVMIMIFYILSFLAASPAIKEMPGADSLAMMLPLGEGVIAIFSLLFLFYTNAFLIRNRNREFGLYNILGMNKKNISRIMVWENLMTMVSALVWGLLCGMAFSKLAELGLYRLMDYEVNYTLSVSLGAVRDTLLIYVVIFLVILCYALLQVWRLKPLALLQSDRAGEKPPKANWLLALLGVIALGAAYYLAVAIEEPLSALVWFFVAVILVIFATYLLFIAGSVVFCRLLQKKKSYYYKPNHFVSVSSMVYRMKRNGAGLASICILGTMVLVMLSSTASLYIGEEDSLNSRYPYDINIHMKIYSLDDISREKTAQLDAVVEENCKGQIREKMDFCAGELYGLLQDGKMILNVEAIQDFGVETYDHICTLYVVSLEDYNRLMHKQESLNQDEVILCSEQDYPWDTLTIDGLGTKKVKKTEEEFVKTENSVMQAVPAVYVITADVKEMLKPLANPDTNDVSVFWNAGYNLTSEPEEQIAISRQLPDQLTQLPIVRSKDGGAMYSIDGREDARVDFYSMYSSLLFLGIILSIAFILATVLIIYYKQISEGYEDQMRFEIMQKVGMTKGDIRRNINSQMRTVFFLPLLFAGLHLGFAFPFVWKILRLLSLLNKTLLIWVTIGCFLVYSVFYILVYRITVGSYYKLVSGKKE